MRWLGVVLFAAGGALRIAPTFVLGRRFSGLVAIQPGHELVTTGLYGTIRHPSYLGLILMMLGWALGFRSLVGVLLALLMISRWRASVPRKRCSRNILAANMPPIAPAPIASFLGFID